MKRTSYRKSDLERDQMCKCGHIAYEHSIEYAFRFSLRYLINCLKGKLYTGNCDNCKCKRFKIKSEINNE